MGIYNNECQNYSNSFYSRSHNNRFSHKRKCVISEKGRSRNKPYCDPLFREILTRRSRLPYIFILVVQLSFDEVAVETSNVGNRLTLRTNSLASTSVSTVTKTEFIHLSNHGFSALGSFGLTLGQQSKLTNLGRNEEHRRTILASCYASSATNASGAVHGFIGCILGNEDGICILRSSGAN